MTETLLVRHAHCAHVGERLAGRAPGTRLDATGMRQAADLAAALRALPVGAIYTGPLERARETAAAMAGALGLEPRVLPAFDEVDYGEWTGRSFRELDRLTEWHAWHRARSSARIPGGELLVEAQARALAGLAMLRTLHPGALVVVVSHAEPLRLVLAHCLGMPIDLALRLEVDPAHLCRVRWHGDEPVVGAVNLPATALAGATPHARAAVAPVPE